MDDVILELAKKHKIWLNYLKSFGCDPETAKDIVQEMYIKVDTYLKKTNNNLMYRKDEVNYYFIYVTLNRMYIDYTRAKKRTPIKAFLFEDYDKDENPEWLKFNPQDKENYEDFLNQEYNDKENEQNVYYEKSKAINEWYNNEDFIEFTSIESGQIDKLDKDKLLNYYLRKIFEEVFIKRKSITKLSKDTKISYYSLYNTIRNIKQQIKKKYETR
jgi:DNA-directed RNA polymerase specialized sigma24 family protein